MNTSIYPALSRILSAGSKTNDCGSWEHEAEVHASSTPGPKKDYRLPDPVALGELFNVGRMATELLNISDPSQATCNVKVLACIVRVNLLLKYLPIDLHTNIENQVKNRCSASSALVLLIICFF